MSCRQVRVQVGETNTISDNKASIRQGIQTLSDELKEAKKKALIAGQPFKPIILGKDYIDYVAKHGGTNS